MHLPAEMVSFQPRELMLSPGKTGEVTVRVVIPAQTRCGVYSGLVRASKLDYLHAVLVVQVEATVNLRPGGVTALAISRAI